MNPDFQISETWEKNYEKVILARKLSVASSCLGDAFINPCMETVRIAHGRIYDYLSNMPTGNNPTNKKNLDDIRAKLDNVGLVLNGNPSIAQIQKLYVKFGVKPVWEREGVKAVMKLQNIVFLINELSIILTDLSDYAYVIGLRFQRPDTTKGWEKASKEEKITDDEIDDVFGTGGLEPGDMDKELGGDSEI